jgi:hypothetical protein
VANSSSKRFAVVQANRNGHSETVLAAQRLRAQADGASRAPALEKDHLTNKSGGTNLLS